MEALTDIIERLNRIEQEIQEMANTVDDDFAAIDAATTAAGARVDALIASIKASGQTLTAAQQAEADAIVTHLTAIGADPANPVPTPVTPTPTP